MSQKINTNKFLKNVRIGLWRIEVEEGKLPRFYADEVMDELLGITEEITPEERFAFHRRCVHPDDMEMFLEYSDKLTETQTEIVYRYIHPISGEMFVRCAGIRDNSVTSGISIIGTHQDISETIRVEKEKEVTVGYLQKLKEAGNFLMDLIGNILEVARIESGKETLTETAWNLCNLEDTLDLLLDRDIYKKQLTLKKNMELQHPKVYCDVLKVREITMNLLSNAVKYTPEGGTIHFTIRELPYEREGYALFQTVVEDTGIGISKEYIPHLFEAFTREKSSSESGIIGTGLGLRIVKKFVDLMEGSIVVESEIGKGTRFTVTIPHRIATANEYISEENAKELSEEITLNNVRILLAEDNMLNAEIAMTLLADANAYVELAPDGEKALSMLKRATDGYYDLIIMDIQMPHMNGYEATKNIRGLPDGRCRIPIIAMTANAFEEDRKRAIESGMNGYVTKPIKIEELISTIKKILKS